MDVHVGQALPGSDDEVADETHGAGAFACRAEPFVCEPGELGRGAVEGGVIGQAECGGRHRSCGRRSCSVPSAAGCTEIRKPAFSIASDTRASTPSARANRCVERRAKCSCTSLVDTHGAATSAVREDLQPGFRVWRGDDGPVAPFDAVAESGGIDAHAVTSAASTTIGDV